MQYAMLIYETPEALASRARGDAAAEEAGLARAVQLGGWDPSLAYLLGETGN